MTQRINDVKNYFFPVSGTNGAYKKPMASNDVKKNLSYAISPVQFLRIRHDIAMWRMAVQESEQAYYPHRVKMQRLFQDTILNEHIEACIERRKNLTLLRKFRIVDAAGNESEEHTKLLQKVWFKNYQSYCIDAKLFGYSLISLGDAVNDSFPDLTVVKRQNISPDRLNVTPFVYSLSGQEFTEPPYSDWHIWVPTPTDIGASSCGYGLLYKIAKTEIYLRNNTGYNADFIELFGQPIRKGKTTKTDEAERGAFEAALRNMGSSAYILLDDGADEVELVETTSGARGFMAYGDFEKRQEAKISKVLLGHSDALDSTPGKLGAAQGGDKSPTAVSLADIQSKDGEDLESITNNQLLPRMRKIGFRIPIEYRFEYLNDDEAEQFRSREDNSNKVTADIFKTISDAGGDPDWKYFSDRTGIKVEKKAAPVIVPPVDPANPGAAGTKKEEPVNPDEVSDTTMLPEAGKSW